MKTHEKTKASKGTLRKVATGLYRFSTSGIYFAHLRIHGKLFRQSLETTDREIANRKLAEFRRKQGRVDIKAGRLTLAQLCDRYAQTLGPLSPSTIKAKLGILKHLREDWPQGANARSSGIKSSDCEIWLAKQAKRMSKSHYNAYLTVLRDVLELAVRDRLIAEHPCEHLKYAKREKPIRLTPTYGEFLGIVEDIRNQPFNADAKDSADFVEFIGKAGLGQAEAAAVMLEDINLAQETFTTYRHKTQKGFVVPIFPQLRPLIERLYNERKSEGTHRLLKTQDARKAIAGACRRLGLPPYTHRSFRRMFITRAIEKGIDVKVIAEWQGHGDGGKLILDTYSHVNRSHSNRMAKLMTSAEL